MLQDMSYCSTFVAMVQATKSRMRKNRALSRPLNTVCYPGFASLIQMRPIVVIIANIIRQKSFQVFLVDSDDVLEQITAAATTQRSATPFCQGLRIEVCTAVICTERMPACTSKPYF